MVKRKNYGILQCYILLCAYSYISFSFVPDLLKRSFSAMPKVPFTGFINDRRSVRAKVFVLLFCCILDFYHAYQYAVHCTIFSVNIYHIKNIGRNNLLFLPMLLIINKLFYRLGTNVPISSTIFSISSLTSLCILRVLLSGT